MSAPGGGRKWNIPLVFFIIFFIFGNSAYLDHSACSFDPDTLFFLLVDHSAQSLEGCPDGHSNAVAVIGEVSVRRAVVGWGPV